MRPGRWRSRAGSANDTASTSRCSGATTASRSACPNRRSGSPRGPAVRPGRGRGARRLEVARHDAVHDDVPRVGRPGPPPAATDAGAANAPVATAATGGRPARGRIAPSDVPDPARGDARVPARRVRRPGAQGGARRRACPADPRGPRRHASVVAVRAVAAVPVDRGVHVRVRRAAGGAARGGARARPRPAPRAPRRGGPARAHRSRRARGARARAAASRRGTARQERRRRARPAPPAGRPRRLGGDGSIGHRPVGLARRARARGSRAPRPRRGPRAVHRGRGRGPVPRRARCRPAARRPDGVRGVLARTARGARRPLREDPRPVRSARRGGALRGERGPRRGRSGIARVEGPRPARRVPAGRAAPRMVRRRRAPVDPASVARGVAQGGRTRGRRNARPLPARVAGAHPPAQRSDGVGRHRGAAPGSRHPRVDPRVGRPPSPGARLPARRPRCTVRERRRRVDGRGRHRSGRRSDHARVPRAAPAHRPAAAGAPSRRGRARCAPRAPARARRVLLAGAPRGLGRLGRARRAWARSGISSGRARSRTTRSPRSARSSCDGRRRRPGAVPNRGRARSAEQDRRAPPGDGRSRPRSSNRRPPPPRLPTPARCNCSSDTGC